MPRKRKKSGPDLDELRTNYAAFAYAMRPDWKPTYFQEKIIAPALERITLGTDPEWKNLIITQPFRYSKPLDVETPVLMADGVRKRLGDIVAGDMVITGKGRPREVTAVHAQGTLPIIRITTHLGRVVYSAPEHPFLTPSGWCQAKDLYAGVTLAAMASPQCDTVSARTDEEFRMAGYFVGDGSTTFGGGSADAEVRAINARISNAEAVLVADIAHCAETLGWGMRQSPSHPIDYSFRGGVRDWLRESGLAGSSAHTKRVPPWVFHGSPRQIALFLAAYYDCDGHVSRKGMVFKSAKIEATTVCRDLGLDIQHLLLRCGIGARLRQLRTQVVYKGDRKMGIAYCLYITDLDNVARFQETIPLRGVKAARLAEWGVTRTKFDSQYIPDPVAAVEWDEPRECKCLTVEEDESFLANDLVVHNTEFGVDTFLPFYFGLNPTHHVILVTYGAELAKTSGAAIKEMMTSELYGQIFPDSRLARLQQARGHFATVSGGKFFAGSFSSGVNGRGANLLCIAQGERVLTKRGWVRIERVRVGDRVATPWSWARVKRTIANGVRPVVRLRCGDIALRLTDDHEMLTPSGWRKAGQLRRGERVYGVPVQAVLEGIRSQGGEARKTHAEILYPGMLSHLDARTLRREAGRLRILRTAAAGERAPCMLLEMSGCDGSQDGAEAGAGPYCLWPLREASPTAQPWNAVLFDGVQKRSSFDPDGWQGEPELQGRFVPLALPPSLQETDVSALPLALGGLHRMRGDDESSRASSGRTEEARCDREHRGPLPTVSHEVSQVEEAGVAEVYDLEVEGDHCFVVEGLYAHNCIDDPHKSLDDLEGVTLERVRRTYRSAVTTRCEPNAAQLLTSARWTPADLIGWRINEEGGWDVVRNQPYTDSPNPLIPVDRKWFWKVLRLQAEAEVDEGWRGPDCKCGLTDEHGQLIPHGEPLWPERWTCAANQQRKQSDPDLWMSSYMLRPTVAGGYMLAGHQPNYYDSVNHRAMNLYIIVDPSMGRGRKADYTSIMVIGTHEDGNYYVLDMFRGRVDLEERMNQVFRLHRKWRNPTGSLDVGYEEYGAVADSQALKSKMERENYRFTIRELGRAGEWHNLSKNARIGHLKPLAVAGRIWLPNPKNPTLSPDLAMAVSRFVEHEWNRHPAADYDDDLDVLSRICDPDLGVRFPMPRQRLGDEQREQPRDWMAW